MGAGASTPDSLNEDQVKVLAGDKFDAAKFQELAVDGKITKEQLTEAQASAAIDALAEMPAFELSLHGDRPATALPNEALLSEAAKASAPQPIGEEHAPDVMTFGEDDDGDTEVFGEVFEENHDDRGMMSLEEENTIRIKDTFKNIKGDDENADVSLVFLKEYFEGEDNALITELETKAAAPGDIIKFEDWEKGFDSIGERGGEEVGMALMDIEQSIMMKADGGEATGTSDLTDNDLNSMILTIPATAKPTATSADTVASNAPAGATADADGAVVAAPAPAAAEADSTSTRTDAASLDPVVAVAEPASQEQPTD